MSILITGFGPFHGVQSNPTEAISKEINGSIVGSQVVHGHVLPVAVSRAFTESRTACRPDTDAIISLGVSTKIDAIHIETTAYNQFASKIGDIEGQGKGNWIIDPAGPKVRHTKLPASRIAEMVNHQGIRCQCSTDPGRYVCNWLYYLTLGERPPAIFVHVPQCSTNWPMQKLVDATHIILHAISDAVSER